MTTMTTSLSSAVVTGAGSGIGRAIAYHLAKAGVDLCLIGRTISTLESLRAELAPLNTKVHILPCDLDKEDDVRNLHPRIERTFSQLDTVVHAAGTIATAPLTTVSMEEWDTQFRVNVRAPLLLTQSLLPLLKRAHGQIVFVNSSLGVRTKENCGAYAASKHALKAVADTLRAEINQDGVRVMSVFPGNTATPMQEKLCRETGKPYRVETLLQPDDVATTVIHALQLPRTAEVTDLHIRPAEKS